MDFSGVAVSGVSLERKCDICLIGLTTINTPKARKEYYKRICKKCAAKKQRDKWGDRNERNKYIRDYKIRKGIIKAMPCKVCNKLCYKKSQSGYVCSSECRFMSHIKKTEKCWEWQASKVKTGYGRTQRRNC